MRTSACAIPRNIVHANDNSPTALGDFDTAGALPVMVSDYIRPVLDLFAYQRNRDHAADCNTAPREAITSA